MRARSASAAILVLALLGPAHGALAHPLRLSLSEIEYTTAQARLTISLRLFLMDVNEALVFDPESDALAFCQPNEAPDAETLLLAYLDQFFSVQANGETVPLKIKSKRLAGEGINTALALEFEHRTPPPLKTLEIRNAVFTDLFFDQNNVIYVHVDGETRSLMLSKKTPVHRLSF